MTAMTRRAAPPRIDGERSANWRDHAVCVDYHPDTFTPEINVGGGVSAEVKAAHLQAVLKALRICGGCPVKAKCLADAYATGDQWTIRGGMTGEQRVQARRREAIRDLYQARSAS